MSDSEQNVEQTPPAGDTNEAIDKAVEAEAAPIEFNEDGVWTALKRVVDPELHYNIVDIGLVYGVKLEKPNVHIDMTLTSPGCPYGPLIIHDVKQSVGDIGAEKVSIDIVWDPPWGPDKMSEEAKLDLGFDMDFDDF